MWRQLLMRSGSWQGRDRSLGLQQIWVPENGSPQKVSKGNLGFLLEPRILGASGEFSGPFGTIRSILETSRRYNRVRGRRLGIMNRDPGFREESGDFPASSGSL